jgi:hypothetical protein
MVIFIPFMFLYFKRVVSKKKGQLLLPLLILFNYLVCQVGIKIKARIQSQNIAVSGSGMTDATGTPSVPKKLMNASASGGIFSNWLNW